MTTREGAKEAPLLLLRAQARTLYVRSCARRRSRARAGEGALPLGPPSNFLSLHSFGFEARRSHANVAAMHVCVR
eukprot:COSAG04_NODE_325_length_16785_cov_23.851792_8_plen_75_part_00